MVTVLPRPMSSASTPPGKHCGWERREAGGAVWPWLGGGGGLALAGGRSRASIQRRAVRWCGMSSAVSAEDDEGDAEGDDDEEAEALGTVLALLDGSVSAV